MIAHDQLGIELVARLEQQVAPDNPFAGQHVGFVACALEPVAARVERHHALDGDVAYGFPGVRFQQPAFVQYAPVHRRIEYGFDEEHPVKHARDCAAVGFGLYAVVEALVALRGRRVQAVGGEPAGGDPVPGDRTPGPTVRAKQTLCAARRVSTSMQIRRYISSKITYFLMKKCA